jgi:hypothetical protein
MKITRQPNDKAIDNANTKATALESPFFVDVVFI